MNIIQLSHTAAPAVEFIETAVVYASKAYAFASEIFTVSAILWCLNLIANGIQKTYEFGYAFGKFYRTYLHAFCKEAVAFVINRTIDICVLAYEGAVLIYTNRQEILTEANHIRNQIGRAFSYEYTV